MEKRKRWQFFLILAVVVLTIYNIFPTIFYYSKPLNKPVGKEEAAKVAASIVERVNNLENFTISWIKAQSKNLGLKPTSITLDPANPRVAKVVFPSIEGASLFEKTLYRAGALIPFIPAQLSPSYSKEGSNTVWVERRIGVHLNPKELNSYFTYIPKHQANGEISEEFRDLINSRAAQIALGFGGESKNARFLSTPLKSENDKQREELIRLSRSIVEYENIFGEKSPITERYFSNFTQTNSKESKAELVQAFIHRLERADIDLHKQLQEMEAKREKLNAEGGFLSSIEQQKLETLENQKGILNAALLIVKRNASLFESGSSPLSLADIQASLRKEPISESKVQYLEIGNLNPFVNKLMIDWNKDTIDIILHDDVSLVKSQMITTENDAIKKEKLGQLLFNEIASVARSSEETISPTVGGFAVILNQLTNSSSLLAFNIGEIAQLQSNNLETLLKSWSPKEGELSSQDYPVIDYAAFKKLPKEDQKLGLVTYAPILDANPPQGFRNGSLYVVAKGFVSLQNKYEALPDSDAKRAFQEEVRSLSEILRQNGFIAYLAKNSDLPSDFKNDLIFELDDYYSYLLAATREDFSVKGNKQYALLEFTNMEQRILTRNKIDTLIHEDLIKWRDEYHASRVSLLPGAKQEVPKPTKNVLWDNFLLSTTKYFRGDSRKILKWGLDLSGGKTVRIGLKNKNNQLISDEADLKQASNELYSRVNRLGVSEVGIRTEGSTIVLDFPGSQGLSAQDLIQASAMYFHVVNEKFTSNNPTLAEAVNTFLEEVWNEAVITNRTDIQSINDIAWKHLGGTESGEFHPISSHAKLLVANGLHLAGPKAPLPTSHFDDSLSAISVYRGKDFTDWQGQTNPLTVVFHNFALEGADLIDVHTSYDSQDGNVLNFGVRGGYTDRDGQKMSPRDDFYAWTSQFSGEKIAGTPQENYSKDGKGWRMAVILNGSIISAPALHAPLREKARISGHFSQREINQLAADLKAGSLSFTPYILSQENISPDLGKEQRFQGILASLIGLLAVIAIMCSYYRFAGVVASFAVLFNLLIIWAVLQNLGAALTLPGLAGIILAIGMSVDANVLVFERIREEFAISNRLPSAIQAGYRKAFSAIVDSNITTIIAAVILLNFDSGPVKGLALTLIIGILSSMFTALFVTRFFFAGWVQNSKNKVLKMARFFGKTTIDFLKQSKLMVAISLVILVIGAACFIMERQTIFGMDFTGGYSLRVDLKEQPGTDYRLKATKAIELAGSRPSDFQIRELNKPYQLRLQLSTKLELPGGPYHGIDAEEPPANPLFNYQKNPRIVWIVNALELGGLELNPASLSTLDLYWSEMSGQLSDTMRNNALIGLGLALIAILIYITFRFEFKFAISATIALAHDLAITVGLLAILHLFFSSVQIDLQVIAALLTIVGYSLNDTIIIFDRIREDLRIMRKVKFHEIVNHALNATLSRTIMTSGTTLVVLLALLIFGGASILNFALVMTIGVAIGTLSSLYVASALLLYFHNKEARRLEEPKPHTNP